MAGPLDAYDRIDINPPPIPAPPPPGPDGFFANFGQAFTNSRLVARSDRFDAEDLRLNREYGPILDALGLPASDNPAGFSDASVHGTMILQRSSLKKGEGLFSDMTTRADQEMLIAAEIGRRQAKDPNFLAGVPATVDGLHKWMLDREAKRLAGAGQKVAATTGWGGTLGGFAGGIAETSLDTPNLVTLPIGGVGRTVARRVLTEGLVMAGITAAEQPTVARNRKQLGGTYTAEDFLLNVGSAAAGGMVLRGAGEGLHAAAPAMGEALRSRFPDWARARDGKAFGQAMDRAMRIGSFDDKDLPRVAARMLDPSLRDMPDAELASQIGREIEAGTIDDRAIASAFRGQMPEDRRTPDEQAALAQVDRDADIAEASPYEPTPAGDIAHENEFAAAIARAQSETTMPPASAAPEAQPAASMPAGAAAGVPVEGDAAIAAFKARTRRAESGGVDRAKNPQSSASGRYQFTRPTWLSYYRRRYGKTGEKTDAIWAKRFDSDLQEVLMDDLTRDNARGLRAAGQPVTERNLYLRHFLGPRADEVLRAEARRPMAELVPADFIARNRKVLEGKTAGEVIAWADRKMGGAGDSSSSPRSRIVEPDDAAGERPAPDMPEGAEAPSRPIEAVDEPGLVETAADEPALVLSDHEARSDWHDDLERPSLRSALFGTPEEHARAQMAVWREQDRAAGLFHEEPQAPAPAPGKSIEVAAPAPRKRYGPVDVMQAIADAGGLLDNEGHDLVKGRGIPKFLLGAGTIVRKDGHPIARSVDAMGEHLWEKGYFGPPSVTPRPDESQVLDLIERGAQGRVFVPGEEPGAGGLAEAGLHQSEADAREELAEAAREHGVELDPATLDAAMEHRAGGDSVHGAVERAVSEAPYRDAPEPAGVERFDDPDMEAAAAQAESLDHDLRDSISDPSDEGEDIKFAFDDGETTIAAALGEADAEAAMPETLRACMVPATGAAE